MASKKCGEWERYIKRLKVEQTRQITSKANGKMADEAFSKGAYSKARRIFEEYRRKIEDIKNSCAPLGVNDRHYEKSIRVPLKPEGEE